ncbi:MAG: HK97 family phage prohead protease [Enterocloster sp.]
MGKQSKQTQMKGSLERFLPSGAIRSVEGQERVVELSFSSEEPYSRWWGVEILDHTEGCMDLTRLNEIGCVLFNHKRDQVIGQVLKAWNENGRGMARIRFDEDEASDVIYKKVQSGTLKGVSVGYNVDSWEEIMPGKKSADGRFIGPCEVAKKWTPFEISIVSVPADPTVGVGRSYGEENRSMEYFERQLQLNKNRYSE